MREELRRPKLSAAQSRGQLLSIAIAAAIMLTARSTLADHYRVPSESMLPTVAAGDRVIVNKAAFGLRLPFSHEWLTAVSMPQRGDVVVLASPEDDNVLLKRVVAIAGDRIEVRRGRLRIDGHLIEIKPRDGHLKEWLGAQPHDVRLSHGGGPDLGPIVVPPAALLVVGDNRGNSHDGRTFGFVSTDRLLGRAVAIYFRGGSLRWIEL